MAEKKQGDNKTQAEKELEERIDRFSEAMLDFHPYDRELFEKMTKEERKSYNNAFKLTGLVMIVCGILWFLFNTRLGGGRGWSLLLIIVGSCMLCYWNNPFCFSSLWKVIAKLFNL